PAALKRVASNSGGEVEIPPPRVKPVPVLRLDRDTMPAWQLMRGTETSMKEYSVEIAPRKNVNPDATFAMPLFVQDSDLESIGELVSMVSESHLAHDGELVYVRIKPGSGHLGAQYLILSDEGELKKSITTHTSGVTYNGNMIRVLAQITLIKN